MLDTLARGFALFINWFDGACAVVRGGLMMVLGLTGFAASWRARRASVSSA